MKNIKITPFFIVALVLVYYSIFEFHLFNFWTLKGGESAIGVNAIISLCSSIILFFVDRKINKHYLLKKTILIELLIIVAYFSSNLFYSNNKKLICKIDDNVEFFVIIYGVEKQMELDDSFPFNKSIEIQKNNIYVTQSTHLFKGIPEIIGKTKKSLASISHQTIVKDKTYYSEIIFFDNCLEETQIDSLKNRIDIKLIQLLTTAKKQSGAATQNLRRFSLAWSSWRMTKPSSNSASIF